MQRLLIIRLTTGNLLKLARRYASIHPTGPTQFNTSNCINNAAFNFGAITDNPTGSHMDLHYKHSCADVVPQLISADISNPATRQMNETLQTKSMASFSNVANNRIDPAVSQEVRFQPNSQCISSLSPTSSNAETMNCDVATRYISTKMLDDILPKLPSCSGEDRMPEMV